MEMNHFQEEVCTSRNPPSSVSLGFEVQVSNIRSGAWVLGPLSHNPSTSDRDKFFRDSVAVHSI